MAGEIPVAVIQLHNKAGMLPTEEMRDFVIRDLGRIHAPALYRKIQDLGLETFPITTSGKVRKSVLKMHVVQYTGDGRRQRYQHRQSERNGLAHIFASIIGQSPESLPWDKPLEELADSINLLRLVANIQRDLSKEITQQDVSGGATLQDLAKRLGKLDNVSKTVTPSLETVRDGPPPMTEMVHTHGDESRVSKTQEVITKVLQPMGMSWE